MLLALLQPVHGCAGQYGAGAHSGPSNNLSMAVLSSHAVLGRLMRFAL
jgi:hypothetical protein